MIVAIGTDILQLSRIKLSLAKKVLSDEEMLIFESFSLDSRRKEYLGGRFAVKEAMIKAIGFTDYRIVMRDITIINDQTGRPIIKAPCYPDLNILISISHEKEYCVGMCVIETV